MKKTLFVCSLLSAAVFFNGCVKQDEFLDIAKEGAAESVGFGSSNLDGIVYNVDAVATPVLTEAINVFLSGKSGGAITVNIAADPAVITAYNDANGSAYEELPADAYTFPTSISIPANNTQGSADFTVDINKLLSYGNTQFAIGLSITSVSGGPGKVMANNQDLFMLINVKNPYDGDYDARGWFFHPSAPRAIAKTKSMVTITAATSEVELGDLGGSSYFFHFDVSGSNCTNWTPVGAAPASPQSNFMTLDNPAGVDYATSAPNKPGVAPYTKDIYNNTYDGDGLIFWFHYGYGVGSSGQEGFTRQTYEKLTRK